MTKKTQTRGVCQVCGRDQAVVGGLMSKHGYTVKHGWFNGICGGQRHKALNVERTVLDATVKAVREEAAILRIRAAALESGEINPVITKRNFDITIRDYVTTEVPYAEASEWDQREARRSAVWNTNRRAEMGENYSNDMERLADRVHGTPLTIVQLDDGPAPILIGERRTNDIIGTMTVVEVRGARVYWTMPRSEGRIYKGWTGTQAWRRLALAEGSAA